MKMRYGDTPVVVSQGPKVISEVPPAILAFPATVPANGSVSSGVIICDGYSSFAVAATLSQTGQISIQRYLDAAATIPIGAAITQALTADTSASKSVSDGVPFQSAIITISNSAGSTGNLSGTFALLGS